MKHFKVKFLVFISAILLFFGVGLFSNLSSMVVYAAPAEGYTETGHVEHLHIGIIMKILTLF